MTKTQLQSYIQQNSNIDFEYNNKKYGIENIEEDNGNTRVHFWEWYNSDTFDTSFSDFTDFEQNAKIDGLSVVEILKNIDDADIF